MLHEDNEPTVPYGRHAQPAEDTTIPVNDPTVPLDAATVPVRGHESSGGQHRTMPLLPPDHHSSRTVAEAVHRRVPTPRRGDTDAGRHSVTPSIGTSGTPITLRIGRGVEAVERSRQVRFAATRAGSIAWRVGNVALTVALVAAGSWAGWQWWQRWHPQLRVGAVTVATATSGTGPCDTEYDFAATIATNGKAGTITYQWIRSDGQSTRHLTVTMRGGQRSATVHLYWTFTGAGTEDASATLTIIDPNHAEGSARVAYACISR